MTRRLPIETTYSFKNSVVMSKKNNLDWKIGLFRSCCFLKTLNSAFWSHSVKIRHDHIFNTSTFVLTGLEILQIWSKLASCGASCRQKLTHWIRIRLAPIYSNNRHALVGDLRMWISAVTALRVYNIDGPPTMFSRTSGSKSLSVSVTG